MILPRLFNDERWQCAAESFIASIHNLSGSENSRSRYTLLLRACFTDPAKSPDMFSRQDIEAYLDRPSTSSRNYGKLIGVGTRNQRLAIVSSFYKYAASYTVNTEGQPQALLQRPAPTLGITYGHPPVSYRALTERELELFFAQIPDSVAGLRNRCIFTWLLLTARRINEVLQLNWSSIVPGPPMMFAYYPKGHSREQRTQELPRECYALLVRYLTASGRLHDMQPDSPLFLSLPCPNGNYCRGNKRFTCQSVNELVKTYAIRAGIRNIERLSSHSFRHSSARLAYSAGADLRSIQQKLGHSSLASTDLYLRTLAGETDSTLPLLRMRLGSILQ